MRSPSPRRSGARMRFARLRERFSKKTLVVGIALAIIATLAITLLVINMQSGEKKIQQRIERLYSTEDPEFIHVMGVMLGPPVLNGNRYRVLVNGDQIFPAMLKAIRAATQDDRLRDLHLLVGSDRQGVRRRPRRASPRRRQGARAARLGRLAEDGGQPRRGAAVGGRRDPQVPPAALVAPRPPQQPHAPQAPRRRRPDRLHRRRRHRRAVDRRCSGPRALARHALRGRGPGRRADAGRLHGQLDQDVGRGAARRRVLPAARAARAAARRRCSAARRAAAARAWSSCT